MNILIITHASFEEPGSISEWAHRNNHQVNEVRPYAGESLPEIDCYDLLIVMGGSQSPLAMDVSPYLLDEIKLIKTAIRLNKCIIGICLGAQLIGEALNAKTEHSPHREVGSFSVELLDAAKDDPVFAKISRQFEVMHWHNDMPGIPEGGKLIAKSAGCPRQIFTYGDRIYGFQCHFELTKELVTGMIKHCSDDLNPGPYVMTYEELMNVDYAQMNHKLDAVLDYLAQLR